jgi:two-component system CheB/CheR fusion protein
MVESSERSGRGETADTRVRVVGIGASAGGIQAICALLDGLPKDPGFAIVVVVHLDPTQPTNLPAVLQAHTEMPVAPAGDRMLLESDHVYVAPPALDVCLGDGVIHLVPSKPEFGPRTTIDRFFRGLAEELGPHAAAVVLSGSGADGTIGLKHVKERGGLTLVQDPADAEQEGMPRSAINTGLVDVVLPASQLATRLLHLAGSPDLLGAIAETRSSHDNVYDTLRDVLTVLRIRSGHDFSQYKAATLLRRVARRMQVCRTPTIAAYLDHLRSTPGELAALQRDFLISVTAFFRDTEAFSALEKEVFPRLFVGKGHDVPVRMWVPGCATGEEAYSLAILAAEHASHLRDPPRVQIFATDIDEDALTEARTGRYPDTIAASVSPDRLERFFHREEGFFRVKKEVRELVLFSVQNVLRDPPFSKLDLVSCRNLLIYLNRDAQERVLAIAHFALQPGGFLFLGSSESAEGAASLFAPVDAKQRIFARRPASTTLAVSAVVANGGWPAAAPVPRPPPSERSGTFGELHHRIVEYYAPPSILVSDELDVVHVSERAGRYLSVSGGEPTRQLLRLVGPGLSLDLRAAIYAARQSPARVDERVVQAAIDGSAVTLRLHVRVLDAPDAARGMLLVIFDDRPTDLAPLPAQRAASDADGMEPLVRQLEDELHRTRDQLRTTIEQYETSLEELKASNEELQAINEELRSATEELETGKEELQSVNEELTTLNHELKDKIDEVSRANADLQNLMTATEIPVVFLDRSLQIKRFTPQAQGLFNMIATDVNRPIAHLTHRLHYDELVDDAAAVLQHLRAIEREVVALGGQRYLARLHPYRSLDDRIDGVVLTFLDVTAVKRAEATVRAQGATIEIAERAASAGVWEIDAAGARFEMSKPCLELFGLGERSAGVGREEWLARIHAADRESASRALDDAIQRGGDLEIELRVDHPTAGLRRIWQVGRLVAESRAIAGIAIDVTERRRTEAALRVGDERLRLALRAAPVFMLTQDRALRYTWGYRLGRHVDFVGRTDEELFPAPEAARLVAIKRGVLERGDSAREEIELTIDEQRHFFDLSAEAIREDGEITGVTTVLVDVTRSKLAELALRDVDRRKDEFLATLAHELRNPLAPMTAALAIQDLADGDLVRITGAREVIQRQVDHMVHLVDDLLDVSRITQGKIHLRQTRFDLARAVEAAVEATRPQIERSYHRLAVDLGSSPIMVTADFTRLTQILTNLLGNAAKYTPPGGQITLQLARDANDRAVISVIDNGVGIPADVLPRVFDMFTQSTSALERAEGGLGIGLALARRLIELHGGTIEARSAGPGKGSEFVVRLPTGEDGHGAALSATPPPTGQTVASKRVLVVDDDDDVRDAMSEVLRMLGHDVASARDASTAIAAAETFRPDVVLLDIGLPEVSGYEVCQRLRETPCGPSMTLVAVSGWGQREDLARGRAAGFDHHIVKPAGLRVIEELVGDARATGKRS